MGVDIMANDFVPHIDFMNYENADIRIIKCIKQIVEEML